MTDHTEEFDYRDFDGLRNKVYELESTNRTIMYAMENIIKRTNDLINAFNKSQSEFTDFVSSINEDILGDLGSDEN